MIFKSHIFLALFLMFSSFVYTQDLNESNSLICGSDFLIENQQNVKISSDILVKSMMDDTTEYLIPMRVHVIHLGEPVGTGTNISDEQIQSQIDETNLHFKGINADGTISIDSKVQYCLDSIFRFDGSVLPAYAENGMAIPGQALTGASLSEVFNLTPRDPDVYYNVYIVSELGGNNAAAGIQAFAYFPWSSDEVRGTVQLYNTFGVGSDYNLKSYTQEGEIFTHEQGHSFHLYHTFRGNSCDEEDNCTTQGDRVCDTPPHYQVSSCSTTGCGGTIPINNYMNYTSETCQNTFSQGQVDRLRASALQYFSNMSISECSNPCYFTETSPVGLSKSFAPVPWPNGNIDRVQLKFYKDNPQIPYSPVDSAKVDIEYWPIRDLINNVLILDGDTTFLNNKMKPGQNLFKWPIKFLNGQGVNPVNPSTRYAWRVRIECNSGLFSPWSETKIFNTPPFDPSTGIYNPVASSYKMIDYLRGRWYFKNTNK